LQRSQPGSRNKQESSLCLELPSRLKEDFSPRKVTKIIISASNIPRAPMGALVAPFAAGFLRLFVAINALALIVLLPGYDTYGANGPQV
jgi:hypothetical protein